MYVDDKENVIYEDIYDGDRLIRKNNKDSVARIYDLIKYPEFRKKQFWGHNTLYGMQYEFRYILDNPAHYSVVRLNDSIIDNRDCYRVNVLLENKMSMPGFATKLENSQGNVSESTYYIDKETYYPIRLKGENYSLTDPHQKLFIDQRYYDIRFNPEIDEQVQFNTSIEVLTGFEKIHMNPE